MPFNSKTGGLDSLGAVEYVNLVGRKLGMAVPATLVYDYPTVEAITAHLVSKAEAAAAAAAPKAKSGGYWDPNVLWNGSVAVCKSTCVWSEMRGVRLNM